MNENIGYVLNENGGWQVYNTDGDIIGHCCLPSGTIVSGPIVNGTQWSVIIKESSNSPVVYTMDSTGTLIGVRSAGN